MSDKKKRRRLETDVQKFLASCGGNKKVAEELRLNVNTPGYWVRVNRIPPYHVLQLCRMTGGAYQPYMIDPEHFDKEVRV